MNDAIDRAIDSIKSTDVQWFHKTEILELLYEAKFGSSRTAVLRNEANKAVLDSIATDKEISGGRLKIKAIKTLRERTGCTLREALDCVTEACYDLNLNT